MMRKKTIAFDFDGTVVSHMYPHIGSEAPDAVRVLKRVIAAGHRLILWTCREDDPTGGKLNYLGQAIAWLYESGLNVDTVNETRERDDFRNPTGLRRKVMADCYIDDRNVGIPKSYGCVDWNWVERQLEKDGWFE